MKPHNINSLLVSARIIKMIDNIYEKVSLQQSLSVIMSIPFDEFLFSEIEFVDS
jgi:hypothetical protein